MRIPAKRSLLGAMTSLALISGLMACSSVPRSFEEQPSSASRSAATDGAARGEAAIADRIQPSLPADWVVFFAPGDAQLSADSMGDLKALADTLKASRDQDVQLTAKSNDIGSQSLCLALAANRLNALVSKLSQLGVHSDQLRQQNMGCDSTKLAKTGCQSAGCIDPNERIEIRLIR